jgi:hypothetical protein
MTRQQPNVLTEHEGEFMPGLPGLLPEGEYVRWQGRPDWRDFAVTALHVRKLALYFVILLAIRIAFDMQAGAPLAQSVAAASGLAILALLALGVLSLLAWLMARAACYTITNQRIIIRCGVALSFSVNLPFARVLGADFRQRANGHGDIPIKLDRKSNPSFIILWPHVRPWSFGSLQPMLRSLPDGERAAAILADALRTYAREAGTVEVPVRVSREERVMAGQPSPSAG